MNLCGDSRCAAGIRETRRSPSLYTKPYSLTVYNADNGPKTTVTLIALVTASRRRYLRAKGLSYIVEADGEIGRSGGRFGLWSRFLGSRWSASSQE